MEKNYKNYLTRDIQYFYLIIKEIVYLGSINL